MSHPIGVKVAPLSAVTTPTTAREIIDLCSKKRRFKAGDTHALQDALTRLEAALPKHGIESGQEYYMQNRAHIRQAVGALAKKGFAQHAQRLDSALEIADASHFGWLHTQLRSTAPSTRRWQLLRTWQALKDTASPVVQQMLRRPPPDFVPAPAPPLEDAPAPNDPRGVLGLMPSPGSPAVVGRALLTLPGTGVSPKQRAERQPPPAPPSPSPLFEETPDDAMRAAFVAGPHGPRLLRGATATALRRLRARVRYAQEDHPRRFLEYVANIDRDVARYDKGWNSVAGISAMWHALHDAACELEAKHQLTPEETAALQHLMRMYRDLYVSAALDHADVDDYGEIHRDLLHRNAVYALMHVDGTRAVTSGSLGHFTVLRGAWVPPHRTPLAYVRANERVLQKHSTKQIPSGTQSVPLAQVLLAGAKPSDFDRAPLADFLTDKNFAVLPCDRADHVTVVYRHAHELLHVEQPVWMLPDFIERLGSREALPSHVKLTTHNGGEDSDGRDGYTRTYDERWLVPLTELDARLVALQHATVQSRRASRRVHEQMRVHDTDDAVSKRNAPWVEEQHLGNCSVHSQKLFLLYELQHPEETPGLSLNALQGTRLFAKLWDRLLSRAYDACAQDDDVNPDWLWEMRYELRFQKSWLTGLVAGHENLERMR